MGTLRIFMALSLATCFHYTFAQNSYSDSLQAYIDDYVKDHEVVKGEDRKYLIFFPIDESYRVNGRFEKANGSKWFLMETSGHEKNKYNCPIPPRENDLPVAIRAGEKAYGKKVE